MKKIFLSLMLAVCLMLPSMFLLTACGDSDNDSTAKVMNVGLNPKLEFVLDKNNEVVSVNALNDDGNHIVSIAIDKETLFEGLTADEAVELFLEIADENGYLITGNEEEISIEVSGDADALMKKVKDKANKYFTDNNLDISIVVDKIEKEDIMEEVKNCMREYTDAELQQMTEEQLINLLKKSRGETKDLLTQELKDVYYNMRLERINIAELESLLSIIEGLDAQIQEQFATFVTNMEALTAKVSELETAYNTYFLSETSDFNVAKDTYISAKEQLLAKRLELGLDGEISEEDKTTLESFETAVAEAKTALDSAKAAADTAITEAKSALNEVIATVKASVEQVKIVLETLGVNLDALIGAKEHAKDNFKTHFEGHEHFGGHVGHDKSHWGN